MVKYIFDRQDQKTAQQLNRFDDIAGTTLHKERIKTMMNLVVANAQLIDIRSNGKVMPTFALKLDNYLNSLRYHNDDYALYNLDKKSVKERVYEHDDDFNQLSNITTIYELNKDEVKLLIDAGAYTDSSFGTRLRSMMNGKEYQVKGDVMIYQDVNHFENNNEIDGLSVLSARPDNQLLMFNVRQSPTFAKVFYDVSDQLGKTKAKEETKHVQPEAEDKVEKRPNRIYLAKTMDFDNTNAEKQSIEEKPMKSLSERQGIVLNKQMDFGEVEKKSKKNEDPEISM